MSSYEKNLRLVTVLASNLSGRDAKEAEIHLAESGIHHAAYQVRLLTETPGRFSPVDLLHSRGTLTLHCPCSPTKLCAHIVAVANHLIRLGERPPEAVQEQAFIQYLAKEDWHFKRMDRGAFPDYKTRFHTKAAAFDAAHPEILAEVASPAPGQPLDFLRRHFFPVDDKPAINRFRKAENLRCETGKSLLIGICQKSGYSGASGETRAYLGLSPRGLFTVCQCQANECSHIKALKAAVILGEVPLPPELEEAAKKMKGPYDLIDGDRLLLLRAQNGVAYAKAEDLLPQTPPPPERLPLLQRYGKLMAAPSDKLETWTIVGYRNHEKPELDCCRIRLHGAQIAELSVSGEWLGATCDCPPFQSQKEFCVHLATLMRWLDERAAAGQLCLTGEDKTRRLRHGLEGWKWDGALEPQEWMREGHTPASWNQVLKGRGQVTNLLHSLIKPVFHGLDTCLDKEIQVKPVYVLHLDAKAMRVIDLKGGKAQNGYLRVEEVLAVEPELATICAPIISRGETYYAQPAGFTSPLKPELGDLIDKLVERRLCTLEDSSGMAKFLEPGPAASYRLSARVTPFGQAANWRFEMTEEIDGKPGSLPALVFEQGFISGPLWRPCDIGRGRLQSRRLLKELTQQKLVLDELSLRRCLNQLSLSGIDQLEIPESLGFTPPPPPEACILDLLAYKKNSLAVAPTFRYGSLELPFRSQEFRLPGDRTRHLEAEKTMLGRLKILAGIDLKKNELVLPLEKMPELLQQALALGWQVRIEGRITRPGKMKSLNVNTGIDWLECQGRLDFDGMEIDLNELISSLRRRDPYILLADGSRGWLDPQAMTRLQRLAALGDVDKESGELRFKDGQALLLESLLHELGPVSFDAAAERARDALAHFDKLEPASPPEGFIGQLRPYQSLGLAWLRFCRDTGLGACLADDMGLGKTVQLLAHLETLRQEGEGPFLVVCPASLLFNWEKEAARFAPLMRVLIQQGTGRTKSPAGLKGADLVLMTYATLRNDIPWLKEVDFACIALDEAQAIKNPGSASALAARLLQGRQKLTLTGTPVENRLDDLWSLFEFLNPGLLGGSTAFGRFAETAGKEAGIAILAKALRPLILRRTKSEVATDLPPLSRQILWCEMEPPQQAYYHKLLAAARIDVLEAKNDKTQFITDEAEPEASENAFLMLERLLRLRQAACCPALCDKNAGPDSPSAKLDALIPMVEELITEKHQILIFSQFTEFLALAAGRLKKAGIAYAYLDGKTRDRGAAVDEFQGGGKGVFLISLKAGGTGLNLVNADYVFLLDPWWNPAVEQQAIDRAHRIGQSRPVTAYRLVTKGSIEEKILELQERKRSLADSILGGEGLDLRSLKREDLEFLLS